VITITINKNIENEVIINTLKDIYIYIRRKDMFYKSLIYSGVFEIRKQPDSNDYYLEQKFYTYKTPPKLYGDMQKYVDFYWKSFIKTNFVGGLMLTGQKGSGKTLISSALCNLAIGRGMQVVEVTNIQFTPALLRFLDDLDNVVLFFDEFGKNFTTHQQDKMLTLLSNLAGRERIVFITENVPQRISEFIRNRPGRIKYSLHFNKLPLKVVEEYCREKQVDVKFYDEFISAYKAIVIFQFDHLIAIVDEHLSNPDMEFNELVELLNVEGLTGVKTLIPTTATNIETGTVLKIVSINPETLTIDELERGSRFYISVELPVKEPDPNEQPNPYGNRPDTISSTLSKDSLTSLTDDIVIFEVKGIRVICNIERK